MASGSLSGAAGPASPLLSPPLARFEVAILNLTLQLDAADER
eukprot:CAMPEP_0182926490 /NCGR_PEP_ID=MMETSP0105_2-20130417/12111_1 /TAXON_ID=81532 ORGANISM="Acanthoeca-like sp., Strain 10tr" /NCGR_SAMPLE_ID=MMETSP0105_2 /ASSEMBLY_ACC=CAM_ASM_000205 /LENGTH=41 /DNA_ID= /DNA_START= /DNA_END= /DNA_ORIENTATION=